MQSTGVKTSRPRFGAVFDLDGTILKTCSLHEKAWHMTFDRRGIEFDRTVNFKRELYGKSLEAALPLYFPNGLPDVNLKELGREKSITYDTLVRTTDLKKLTVPGFIPFFGRLTAAGIPTSLGTNCAPIESDYILKSLGIAGRLTANVNGSKVSRVKPDPEIFLTAAGELGIPPADCIVFEDSASGIEAAVRSGAKCIVIGTTLSQKAVSALPFPTDLYVRDFRHLTLGSLSRLFQL